MKKINLLIITATLGFGLVSCSSDSIRDSITEAVIENQSGEDVEVTHDGDGNMTIKGENGEEININVDEDGETGSLTIKGENGEEVSFSSNTELPDDLPSNVYIIDGEVQAVMNMDNAEGKIISFTVKVDDNVSDVMSDIKAGMDENDWKASANMMTGDEGMIMYSNEKNQVQIVIAKDGENTIVSYSITDIK